MADKDINIHIKAKGADRTERELQAMSDAMLLFGDATDKATGKGREHNAQTDQATAAKKRLKEQMDRTHELYNQQDAGLRKMANSMASVQRIATGMIATLGGISAINKLWQDFIAHLERVRTLQQDIYKQGMSPLQVGQSLEFQTGTVGQSRQWAAKATQIQKAGSLTDTSTAGAMMIAADVNLPGGIGSPKNFDLVKDVIAPFAGAADLSAEEAAKLLEFAQTAGIEPTKEAWQKYLAQLQAGFTASKATNFGQFMTGLQRGATPYMAAGGSLTEAISLFSGARSVTASEPLAGTLLEQVTRISGGAYEKPRQAMEEALGLDWSQINTDQRAAALLQYARSLPENQRAQFLAEAGFPPELINQINRLVTPGGMETIDATRKKIEAASPAALKKQTAAFAESDLGKQRQIDAAKQESELSLVSELAPFERVLQQAKNKLRVNLATDQDLPLMDRHEPAAYILDDIIKSLEEMPALEGEDEQRRLAAIKRVKEQRETLQSANALWITEGLAESGARRTYENYRQFVEETAPQTTIINNNNNVIYNQPDQPARPRSAPEDL